MFTQLFYHPENELSFTDDSLVCIDDFLKHQNFEIQRSTIDMLCSDNLDVSMLLKNSSKNTFYLCSFPSINMRTIIVQPVHKPDPSLSLPVWVKARFTDAQTVYYNDFNNNPVFTIDFKVRVDCSSLQMTNFEHLYVRALNANEHRPKTSSNVTVEANYHNNAFNWMGKTKIKIDKEDVRPPEVLKQIEVSKERDWSSIEKSLKEIPNIQHFAILDSNTLEIWVSSEGFCFQEYNDESIKLEIDERASLFNLFKTRGNVQTKIGIRLMREKFNFPKEGGYNENTHTVKFYNGNKSIKGIAARNNLCIFVATYKVSVDRRLNDQDPEYLLRTVYNRISDTSRIFTKKNFHENHTVCLRAAFSSPGCYEVNLLLFTNDKGQIIGNTNQTEEVKVVIKHKEMDLLSL